MGNYIRKDNDNNLEFDFAPQYSMNYITTKYAWLSIEVFNGDIFIKIESGQEIGFSIDELRFMADCAEKLQKARDSK